MARENSNSPSNKPSVQELEPYQNTIYMYGSTATKPPKPILTDSETSVSSEIFFLVHFWFSSPKFRK